MATTVLTATDILSFRGEIASLVTRQENWLSIPFTVGISSKSFQAVQDDLTPVSKGIWKHKVYGCSVEVVD